MFPLNLPNVLTLLRILLVPVLVVALLSEAPNGSDITMLTDAPKLTGGVNGTGARFEFDYKGPDTAAAINALLKDGASVAFAPSCARHHPAVITGTL